MKKILIVCGAGVTSSLIAKELNEKLESQGYYIVNSNVSYVLREYYYFHLILISPQLKFMFQDISQLCQSKNILCHQLEFNDYNTLAIENIIKDFIMIKQVKKLKICFVKDDQTGYLCQLFIKKLEDEFLKNQYEVDIILEKYSSYHYLDRNEDYIIFEPKLLLKMTKEKNCIYVRSSDFHTLNPIPIVENILKYEG
jgi:Phosphotransferase system cellobiose-specific component IIB